MIAREAEFAEDEIVERGDGCALALGDARTRLQTQLKQPRAIVRHIETGLLFGRDDERRLRQIKRRFRSRHKRRKLTPRRFSQQFICGRHKGNDELRIRN